MLKALDFGIVVSEFKLKSRYFVHFRTNILRKDMNPLILPSMSYIEPLQFFFTGIGIMVRVFVNGPEVLGSIPGRVIPKTQKMVLDASLLYTQHY